MTPNPSDTFATYTYDPVGNRLSEATCLGTTTYAYDDADRLTSRTPPGSSAISYTYDDNGNQTAAGSATFEYDFADRMVEATVGATTETYTRSGDGIRLSASTGVGAASTTKFVVDRNFGLPQVVEERDGNDDPLTRYDYGLGLTAQVTPSTGPFLYHADGLGSVTDVTNAVGASLSWTEYQPFGLVRTAGASGAPTNPFAYTGQYLDSASGLYHLRARQYDPVIGRFLSVDPVVQSVTEPLSSSYSYARSRPTVATDPSGGCPMVALAFAFGGAGTVVGPGGTLVAGAAGVGVGAVLCIAESLAWWNTAGQARDILIAESREDPTSLIYTPEQPPVLDPRPPGEDPFGGPPRGLPPWAKVVAAVVATLVSVNPMLAPPDFAGNPMPRPFGRPKPK